MRSWGAVWLVVLGACAADAAPPSAGPTTRTQDAGETDAAEPDRELDAAVEAAALEPAGWVQTPTRAVWLDDELREREPVADEDRFDPDELYIALEWSEADGGVSDMVIAPWDRPEDARFGAPGAGQIDRVTGEIIYGVYDDALAMRVLRYRADEAFAPDPRANDVEMPLPECQPIGDGMFPMPLRHFLVPETGALIIECGSTFDDGTRLYSENGEELGSAGRFLELAAVGLHGLTLWSHRSGAALVDAEGYAIQPIERAGGCWAVRAIEEGFLCLSMDDSFGAPSSTRVSITTLRTDGSVAHEHFPEITLGELPFLECAFRSDTEVVCIDTYDQILGEAEELLFYRLTLGTTEIEEVRLPLPVLRGGATFFVNFVGGSP